MDNNEQMTLEKIRQIHLAHCGFIWQCKRDVKGKQCRHLYEAALIRESDRQIEAQRQSAAERMTWTPNS